MKKKLTDSEKLQKIYDICVNITAHNQLDMEVTLKGNGINSSEALLVVWALEEVIGKTKKADINRVVKQIKSYYPGVEW